MTTTPSPVAELRATTSPGRWALRLFILAGAAFLVMTGMVLSGQRLDASLPGNLMVSIPAGVTVASTLAGAAAGFYAMGVRGERSPMIVAGTSVGAVIAIFLVGALIAPL